MSVLCNENRELNEDVNDPRLKPKRWTSLFFSLSLSLSLLGQIKIDDQQTSIEHQEEFLIRFIAQSKQFQPVRNMFIDRIAVNIIGIALG